MHYNDKMTGTITQLIVPDCLSREWPKFMQLNPTSNPTCWRGLGASLRTDLHELRPHKSDTLSSYYVGHGDVFLPDREHITAP